jgi:hypothetical protein
MALSKVKDTDAKSTLTFSAPLAGDVDTTTGGGTCATTKSKGIITLKKQKRVQHKKYDRRLDGFGLNLHIFISFLHDLNAMF